jgi:hypothetical protein
MTLNLNLFKRLIFNKMIQRLRAWVKQFLSGFDKIHNLIRNEDDMFSFINRRQ